MCHMTCTVFVNLSVRETMQVVIRAPLVSGPGIHPVRIR